MKYAVRTLFVAMIFGLLELTNVGRYTTTTLSNLTTFALFRAAHDASLQVDPVLASEGYIVFMPDAAREAFMETMSRNLGMKPDLTPKPGSFIEHPMEIVYEEFVDDSSGVTFPFNYRNDQYHIYQTLEGPSVIYAVRIRATSKSNFDYNGYLFRNIVQQYPFPG